MWIYSEMRSRKYQFLFEFNRTVASHCACIQAGYDIFWQRGSLSQIALMATALLGQIESYDSAQEEWPQYVERLEQFFVANEITGEAKAEKRRATFLLVVGHSSYTLLRSLIAPAKPAEKTFKELVEVLSKHYSPQPTEMM